MTECRKTFQEMLAAHAELFEAFEEVHAQFVIDPDNSREQFNMEGKKVLEVVREYENRLCNKSQRTGYAAFTTRLAEKFQELVKAEFPKIDEVGVLIVEPGTPQEFSIRKITFSS